MKNNNNKSIIICIVCIVAIIISIIVVYRLRLLLWFADNERDFEILIEDIRNMKVYPLEEISYQDGVIKVPQLRYDYQTGEHYIISCVYDGPKLISEESVLIDYDEFANIQKEVECRIADDIDRIKKRIWTGDNKLLSCINVHWDFKGNILVYIRMKEEKIGNTEKIWVSNYVYMDKGFLDDDRKIKGNVKKIKDNWYIQERKIDVG